MSQPLAPRPLPGGDGSEDAPHSQRPRKISTACGACKQRKTRCTGGIPCEACTTRRTPCVYDATSDQRRKIANQRNMQDLADAHLQLERHRQLLGGMIATIRAGDFEATADLMRIVRSGVDLSQLAAHVRNEARSSVAIQQAFDQIDFVIDGPAELPSPSQVLGPELTREDSMISDTRGSGSDTRSDTVNNSAHMSEQSEGSMRPPPR